MPDMDRMKRALRNAHEAGDTQAAQRLARAIQQQRGQEAPPGNGETLLQGAAGGFNTGVASIMGAPGDIAAMATSPRLAESTPVQSLFGENAVTRGADAVLDAPRRAIHAAGQFIGSDNLRESADGLASRVPGTSDDVTMFPEGPDTAGGRLINRASQEVGAAAIPAAGILRAARGTPQALRAAPTLWQTFADPIRRSPGTAAVGETAAAAGAGAGAAIARESNPDSAVAETYGAIAGGFAPTALMLGPAGLAMRGVHAARNRMSPQARGEAAQKTVADYLGSELSTEQRDALREADSISDMIDGFNPTLAERTGSPGLIAKQRQMEQELTGSALDAAHERRRTSEQAVQQFADRSAPRGDPAPDVVVDTARQRVMNLRDATQRQAESQRAEMEQFAGTAAPQTDRAAAGARLREQLAERIGDEAAAFRMVATESGLNDPSFVVPFNTFRDELLQAYQGASQLQMREGVDPLASPPRMISRIQEARDIQNFPALMELRSDIAGEIRRAERMPSVDDTYLRGLRAMKGQFDTSLERLVQQTNDPDIARRYAEFRRSYREQYLEPLRQGASHDVLHRDAQGAYITPDERVVEAYFSPGNVTAARQFNRVFQNDPVARSALESVALDSLRNTAVRDGVIDQRALQNWIRNHDSVLREFPDLARRIGRVDTANAALTQRQRQLVNRERAVENAVLTREMRRFDRDSANADDVISRAMESPRKMGSLAASVRTNPEAKNALRRAVWDRVADMEPGNLAQFLVDNRGTMRAAGITNEQIDALRVIDGARAIMSRTPTPSGSAATPDSVASFIRVFGIRPDTLSNRIHAFHTGRTEKTWLATNLATNIMTRKQSQFDNQVWHAVLYDREIANSISRIYKSGNIDNRTANRLQARFFAAGLPMLEQQAEGNQSNQGGN